MDYEEIVYDRVHFFDKAEFFRVARGQEATLLSKRTFANRVKTLRDANFEDSNLVSSHTYKITGFVYIPIPKCDKILDWLMNETYMIATMVDMHILRLPLAAFQKDKDRLSFNCSAFTKNPYENFGLAVCVPPKISKPTMFDLMVLLKLVRTKY